MGLIAIVHLILCVVLIGLVLIQDFKGGAMGMFGGGGSQSVFGASGGENFLVTLTKWVCIGLLATVLAISFMNQPSSVFEKDVTPTPTEPTPSQPKTPPPSQ